MTADITRVREGNTGILYLQRSDGTTETFFPNCDLEHTRELLLEFQDLRDVDGRALKDGLLGGRPQLVSRHGVLPVLGAVLQDRTI